MATSLHPIIAGPVTLFVECQGGTYKGIREVIVLVTDIYRFHRVKQLSVFRILDIDRSQKVTTPFGAAHHHHDKRKHYEQKSFHASKIRLFPNPEDHFLRNVCGSYWLPKGLIGFYFFTHLPISTSLPLAITFQT